MSSSSSVMKQEFLSFRIGHVCSRCMGRMMQDETCCRFDVRKRLPESRILHGRSSQPFDFDLFACEHVEDNLRLC